MAHSTLLLGSESGDKYRYLLITTNSFTRMTTLCEIDGSQLSGKSVYSHNKLHLNSEYECLLCRKVFQTKQYLQRHQKTVHVQQGISCDQCEKTFSKNSDLKRHKTQFMKRNKIIPAKFVMCTSQI